MYYSLMFDIELVTYAKVNFTKSTEKAPLDALQTRDQNSGTGQGTLCPSTGATKPLLHEPSVTSHTLLLVAMRNKEKQPGQLSTLIAEQFSQQSLPIQLNRTPGERTLRPSSVLPPRPRANSPDTLVRTRDTKLVISRALGKYQNSSTNCPTGLVLIYPSCRDITLTYIPIGHTRVPWSLGMGSGDLM